jgi:phosphate-selective porin OprO/OprP
MMLRNSLGLLGAASLMAVLAAQSANAQSAPAGDERIDQLQSEIKTLEHEIQGLKGRTSAAEKAYATATPLTKAPKPLGAVAKMSEGNRPSICTADGLNCVGITSRLHFDVGGYWYRPNTTLTTPQKLDNGEDARRARIGLVGTFMGDWNYGIVYDFGGTSDGLPPISGAPTSGIENAFVSYVGVKPLAFEIGYMAMPYTLDDATNSNDIMFMERSSPQSIATSIAAGDGRSAVGVRGNTDRFWAGAYLTGPSAGTTHIFTPTTVTAAQALAGTLVSPGFAEQIGGFGRMSYQLLQDPNYSLHIGGDAEFLFNAVGTNTLTLSDRPELRIDPTAILSTGSMTNIAHAQVYSGEAAAGYGSLFAQAEYFSYNVERLIGLPSVHFTGWYAEGSWTITGESRKYNPAAGSYLGIVPMNPFSLSKGGWGAWEIAARYSTVNLNDLFTPGISTTATNGVAGGVQSIYTAGLNWYPNRNVRLEINYLYGTIDKFNGSTAPLGADIGAKFNALATRVQVAF